MLYGKDKWYLKGWVTMDKNELIDCICQINRGVKPEFLDKFSEEELSTYLEHLMELDLETMALCN
jgi:hypothetical protein